MTFKLNCQECDYAELIPMHCKQPMHIETVEGEDKLLMEQFLKVNQLLINL